MITYLCKYTPLELLHAMGAELTEPNTDAEDFRNADAVIHSSVCMHAKLLLETAASSSSPAHNAVSNDPAASAASPRTAGPRGSEARELILTNCCDSIRRVYDTLPVTDYAFSRMLDLPHGSTGFSVELYSRELRRLKQEYQAYSGADFRREVLLDEWKKLSGTWKAFQERGPFIAILGARVSDQLRTKIRDLMPLPVIDLTCGGLRTMPPVPENAASLSDDDLITAYAKALLSQIPCTRMEDISPRGTLIRKPELMGIVYHSVKFCDYYSFEYADIRRTTALPILKIESDFTSQSEGQLATRIAAFSESLGQLSAAKAISGLSQTDGASVPQPGSSAELEPQQPAAPCKGCETGERGAQRIFRNEAAAEQPSKAHEAPSKETAADTAQAGRTSALNSPVDNAVFIGIDSGSTSTNCAAIDRSGKLLAWSIVRTGAKAGAAAESAIQDVKNQLGDRARSIKKIVATGYGREFIPQADATKTEISCHALGAHFSDQNARTVIDIGGQDSKVICLDEDGNVMNFVMNDKCAAGTGRFLEMMAATLELTMDEMSRLGLKWKKDLTISSTCTVFAESEVVGLIAENAETGDIIHALDKSVASRTVGMVKRVRGAGPFMMTGGVAKNAGVAQEIERRLDAKLSIMEHPDLIGAIGAALFARS